MTSSPAGGSGRPASRVVAILEPRLEFARLIEVLVRERFPDTPVRAFTDPREAEAWVAAAEAPVLVLADVDAGAGREQIASWSSRAGRVDVLVLAEPGEDGGCPQGLTPRPARLEGWRATLERALGPSGAWHTPSPWRTPPAPDFS